MEIRTPENIPYTVNIPILFLAAGLGIRARSFTHDLIPKQMIPLSNNMTIIELSIRNLFKEGYRNFFFATGHHGKLLQKHVLQIQETLSSKTETSSDTQMNFYYNQSVLGPVGRIYYSVNYFGITSDFIAVSSDVFFPYKRFLSLFSFHQSKYASLTLGGTSVFGSHENGGRTIIIDRDSKNVVKILDTNKDFYPDSSNYESLLSTGLHVINGRQYALLVDSMLALRGNQDITKIHFGNDLLPYLIAQGKVFAQDIESKVLDMGTPENIEYGVNNWQEFI
jgi:NDP-sugar pyrophosphorylase family protein